MRNKIHILGASGSGASTLGKELSLILPHVNLDGDDYLWLEKFTKQKGTKREIRIING